jgi:hypothetical protein
MWYEKMKKTTGIQAQVMTTRGMPLENSMMMMMMVMMKKRRKKKILGLVWRKLNYGGDECKHME